MPVIMPVGADLPWAVRRHELEVQLVPMRSDDPPVGQQVTGVLEYHDAVAEQAPALLRVSGHDASGFAVRRARRGTGRLMRTFHDVSPGHNQA